MYHLSTKPKLFKTIDLAHVNPATATKLEHSMPEVNNIPFNYSLCAQT